MARCTTSSTRRCTIRRARSPTTMARTTISPTSNDLSCRRARPSSSGSMNEGEADVIPEHIQVDGLYGAQVYSHAIRVGDLVFCSGMSAREPDGSVHAPGDPG